MKFSTITNAMLTNTTLMAKNERIPGASIFPFFNKSGEVEQLMVVLPKFSIVFMIPFKKGLATVSFWGVVTLDMDLAEIQSHSNFTPEQIEHLNHYDPKWHLSQQRFAGYWAKNPIKRSNCADHLAEKVRSILFSKDLSSIGHFMMKSFGLNLFKSIPPETLLTSIHPGKSETSELPNPSINGWHLDPIWKLWNQGGIE